MEHYCDGEGQPAYPEPSNFVTTGYRVPAGVDVDGKHYIFSSQFYSSPEADPTICIYKAASDWRPPEGS